MLKNRKIFMVAIIGVAATIIACSMLKTNNGDSDNQVIKTTSNTNNWLSRYPQLGTVESVVANTNSAESKTQDKTRAELIGKITNQYGIRDDILEFILNTVPSENKQGIEAAIHYAQNEADIFFAEKPEEARYAYELGRNIDTCMDIFLGNNLYNKTTGGIADLYRNTPERKTNAKEIADNVLSGHIYGSTGIMANSGLMGYQDQVKFCKDGGIYWK